jgi:hypothetical protein
MVDYFAHMNDLPVLVGVFAASISLPVVLVVVAIRILRKPQVFASCALLEHGHIEDSRDPRHPRQDEITHSK